jgi:hypothetical protein
LATPNYGYEKRQKELAKKKKKEEKLKHKAERKVGEGAEDGAPEDDAAAEPSELNPDTPAQP